MSKKPILIMQMQRMGDLILTYPLMLWLEREYPGHPIYVAAGEQFYKPLMRFSPTVNYFPFTDINRFFDMEFEAVINLSLLEVAASLTYHVKAERKVGPTLPPSGNLYMEGGWELYRASLVENNLYNRYHWADLNALSVVPLSRMAETRFDPPRTLKDGENKVGLFLGASEEGKRPTAQFWSELIHQLLGRGMRPVLFGGPAEVELGDEVMRLANAPALNMCGKLSLEELGMIGQTLSLFITPDTGPMHLAAWTGLKCLNLSMGFVNPWETGPYQPGHFVLRADMECAKGCWHCTRDRLYCHDPFDPKRVAVLATRMAAGDGADKLARMKLPGLVLWETGRDEYGLYSLNRLDDTTPDEERLVSRFWQSFFGARFQIMDQPAAKIAWEDLSQNLPGTAERFLGHLPELTRQFMHGFKTGAMLDDGYWTSGPKLMRPFTGFCEMELNNGNYRKDVWRLCMSHLEALTTICR